jgi:hypothetical protein
LADYVTRLKAEVTFWRLWVVVIGPMIWPTLVAWVVSLWPATWPTPLRISAGLLSVLVGLVVGVRFSRRVAWLLVDPVTPQGSVKVM